MSIADEFEKLQSLHDSGTLTDAEFADAKAKVLAAEQPQNAAPSSTQQDIRRLQVQNELLRIDQEWAVERENYLLRGRYGSRTVPTAYSGIAGMILVCILSLGLIIFGLIAPKGGFLIVMGLVGIVASVSSGVSISAKATAYDEAYERYQTRRSEMAAQLDRVRKP